MNNLNFMGISLLSSIEQIFFFYKRYQEILNFALYI